MRVTVLSLLLCFALPMVAQVPVPAPAEDEPAATETAPDDVTVSDQAVAVDAQERVGDTSINDRLAQLLEATQRFDALQVRVEDGVVFLSGTAADQGSKELAGDLARRTEGVAVVVNNLKLEAGPLWTLGPARAEAEDLLRTVIRSLPLVALGLLLLGLSLLLAGAIARGATRLFARTTESELLHNVVRKAVYVMVVITGIYLFLRISGLTRVALTVVSGTGLLGLALGFAFRDIAENFLASILLSIQRPFRLGDVIQVDGHTGVVQKVTSRGTLLIDFDGNHIQLANATVYKNTIKNFTANPNMRADFTVGIGYDADAAEAQEVVRRTLKDHPAVLDDPASLVLVEELGAATVNLHVYFWVDGSQHSLLKVKSAVLRQVMSALTVAGISMPDEAREVIFPQGVPVVMQDDGGSGDSGGPGGRASAEKSEVPPIPRPTPSATPAPDATAAEGNLCSETADLQKQAAQARDPEQGRNVLAEETH
jgi:small-conductance mechanosensitive channel